MVAVMGWEGSMEGLRPKDVFKALATLVIGAILIFLFAYLLVGFFSAG